MKFKVAEGSNKMLVTSPRGAKSLLRRSAALMCLAGELQIVLDLGQIAPAPVYFAHGRRLQRKNNARMKNHRQQALLLAGKKKTGNKKKMKKDNEKTQIDITPTSEDKITASSEFNEDVRVKNLVDGDLHSIFNTADNAYGKPGQKCPWIQLELDVPSGTTTTSVGEVHLTSWLYGGKENEFFRLRRLLFLRGKNFGGGGWNVTDESLPEGDVASSGANAGIRVLVTDSFRDRADTSQWFETGDDRPGWYKGTAAGDVCQPPVPSEVCDWILCDEQENAATCKDRFEPTEQDPTIGTAVVDCKGKQGKYLIVELPGVVEAAGNDAIRVLNLNEVKVFGAAATSEQGLSTHGGGANQAPEDDVEKSEAFRRLLGASPATGKQDALPADDCCF
ncbi:unnamed protein product [Amoebophrya sp. A120]|nr:unnamed protein product [Amoebophrya sp. A120]|eukprot:GSA120T00006924001.1